MDPMEKLYSDVNFWTGAIRTREEMMRRDPNDASIAAGLDRLKTIADALRKGRYKYHELQAFHDWYYGTRYISAREQQTQRRVSKP